MNVYQLGSPKWTTWQLIFNHITKPFGVSFVFKVNLCKLLINSLYNLTVNPTRRRFAPHMVKVLGKYAGFLGILLLSGYCVLSASITYQPDLQTASIHLNTPAITGFGVTQQSRTSFIESNSSTSRNRKFVTYAEVNEAEEDELTSSKKYSKYNACAASHITNVLENRLNSVALRLTQYGSFSKSTSLSTRYILFCDFRVWYRISGIV